MKAKFQSQIIYVSLTVIHRVQQPNANRANLAFTIVKRYILPKFDPIPKECYSILSCLALTAYKKSNATREHRAVITAHSTYATTVLKVA